MNSYEVAAKIIHTLKLWGMKQVVLCPGGRNAPFVQVLSEGQDLEIHSGFDERASSFFALGLSRAHKEPVAVITTSGTATAELLPAVIEAHYTQTPLVVITADRPKTLRGTGAPQTIQQMGIFENYVEAEYDVHVSWDKNLASWSVRQPLHINVCFDEPLWQVTPAAQLPKKSPYQRPHFPLMKLAGGQWGFVSLRDLKNEYQLFQKGLKKPLLILGDSDEVSEAKKQFVEQWQGYVYVEGISGYSSITHPRRLYAADLVLADLVKQKKVDSVLRLGGVPTMKFWRELERYQLPTLSMSDRPFSGLSYGNAYLMEDALLSELSGAWEAELLEEAEVLASDQAKYQESEALLGQWSGSEAELLAQLFSKIPKDESVYLGNSMPIRYWDRLCQKSEAKEGRAILANRGANGIDGQLSTALGHLHKEKTLWVILGDLTALYDANALWFLGQAHSLKLVVVNNRGGRIFDPMFPSELFLNAHSLNFKAFAEQWGLEYFQEKRKVKIPETSSFLLEICPDQESTQQEQRAYKALRS